MNTFTQLLDKVGGGDEAAAEELLPLVYEELRRLARRDMAAQPAGHTLQATALVHEAYLKLTGGEEVRFQDRTHFFRAAAAAMRHVLIDHARKKGREKRGGSMQRVDLQDLDLATSATPDTLLVVHEALDNLARTDARKAELVSLRFFAGLGNAEAAEALGLSLATVKRDWDYSRAWLLREITRLQNT